MVFPILLMSVFDISVINFRNPDDPRTPALASWYILEWYSSFISGVATVIDLSVFSLSSATLNESSDVTIIQGLGILSGEPDN